MKKIVAILILTQLLAGFTQSQHLSIDRNKPERIEWFRDAGFGLMITWSPDVLLGSEISLSLDGASKNYMDWYFNELSEAFKPESFKSDDWASLAKLAGVKYVVITAKHHNGFCMWNTTTTDFMIMNSGFGRDMLKETIEAFRNKDIAIGLTYAVSDFHVLHRQGQPPNLRNAAASPAVNSELWEMNKIQLRELLTNYGKIDILSIEDKQDWANPLVANFAWDLGPDLLITGGGMEIYDFSVPKEPKASPWELRINAGYHRQYVATDHFKSPQFVIERLIETRAKGGNLLLNIGPDANGVISTLQENILRQTGNWLAVNREAIVNIRPATIIHENGSWFTQSKSGQYIYAFVNQPEWKWTEERAFFFQSLSGTSKTRLQVLGQYAHEDSDKQPWPNKPVLSVIEEGVFVGQVKKQNFNKSQDFPVVLRFEGAVQRQ